MQSGYGGSAAAGTPSPFITQTAWFVNATTGNDNNNGASAVTALKTLPELSRRFNGKQLAPTMAALTVTLDGVFPDILDLHFDSPGATNITIQGTMGAQDFTGTVDVSTVFNPGGGVRASILDAAIGDFTPFKQHRMRMADGPAAGGLTSFTSVVAATTANIGQFYTTAFPETQTRVDAANGNTYVLEPWSTSARGIQVDITGQASTIIRDVLFQPTATTRSFFSCTGNRVRARFFGCAFDGTQQHILSGAFGMISCMSYGTIGLILQNGIFNQYGACIFSPFLCSGVVSIGGGSDNMHDGDGARTVYMNLASQATVNESRHRCFFGCTNLAGIDSLVFVQGQSVWDMGAANALFWGSAGNLTTRALTVQNSCGVMYVTKPTATGVAPGTDVVLAGGAPIAWGVVPAAAAPPENAYVLVRH